MKSVITYPYGPLSGATCCRLLHAKNLAITSAIYTINISLLIVLLYSWRISVNIKKPGELEDVYYGVQIAYCAIIATQMAMIVLSIMLVFGIYKERAGLIVPWIIGYITFMALEAVAMVYSNVLRDHVNKQFDAMCKAEVAFFIARALINVLAMWGVLRFYNLVRAGITWRGRDTLTTLSGPTHTGGAHHQRISGGGEARGKGVPTSRRHGGGIGDADLRQATGCCFFDLGLDYDDDEDEFYIDDEDDEDEDADGDGDGDDDDAYGGDEDNAYGDYYDGDEPDGADCSMLGGQPYAKRVQRGRRPAGTQHRRSPRNNNIRSVLISKRHNKYKIARPQTRLEVINEGERSAGSGSDENDTLLVGCGSSASLTSV